MGEWSINHLKSSGREDKCYIWTSPFTQWLQGAQVLSSNMLAQNGVLDAARGFFADCMVTM